MWIVLVRRPHHRPTDDNSLGSGDTFSRQFIIIPSAVQTTFGVARHGVASVNYEGFRQYNVAKSILQNPFLPLFECAWLFGAPGDVNILESYLTSSLLVVELLKSGSRVGPYPLTLFPLQSPDTRRRGRRVLLSAPQGGFLQNSY